MRIYEELFIVRPDASEEEIDLLIDQTKQVITGGGRHRGEGRQMGHPQARPTGWENATRASTSCCSLPARPM